MGSLSLTLTHLDISGRRLTHFSLALTRLVALECLKASANEFAEVPRGITALSRLTKLMLGRYMCVAIEVSRLHEKRLLDVHALGGLSACPALCELTFSFCEVMMCDSVLGAAGHAALANLVFHAAHPAPGCAPMVLQLSQALRQRMRDSVLRPVLDDEDVHVIWQLSAHGRAPFDKFRAALRALGQ